MFFVLSKTIGYLTYPLSLALLVLVASGGLRKRNEVRSRRLFWVGFGLLWLLSTPLGAYLLLNPLERPYLHPAMPRQADAIVTLGGSLSLANSEPGRLEYQDAADRFIYTLKLARRLPQAVVIFSGGTADLLGGKKTEATLLKGEAVELGLAPERIFVDDRSRNTRENAVETKRMLAQTHGTHLVLITSAFHMRRSLACLRKVGLSATPYAVDVRGQAVGWLDPRALVPTVNCLADSSAAVREYIGLAMYRLQGYV